MRLPNKREAAKMLKATPSALPKILVVKLLSFHHLKARNP
jgi:hypothetical protein